MDPDTDIGGPLKAFPGTHCSLVLATGSPDPQVRKQAFASLVAAYWKPIYKYIRLKRPASNEDAKDLTQTFFTRALEKGFFERYDPSKARFRTYLRVCLDGFLANEHKSAGRIKRGGEIELHSLDFESAEREVQILEPAAGTDLDQFFHREWVRSLFSLVVEDLRRECEAAGKQLAFALFERYDLEGPDSAEKRTYAQLGEEVGLTPSQVTNHLASVRRQFRALVLDRLRATTGNDEEFREEARRLLGGDFR